MRIFIGVDHRSPVAFNVTQQSILNHISRPVSIHPLLLKTLPITRRGLTDFTFARFLVPFLCAYSGRALFMDSDFMARADLCDMPIEDGRAACVSKNVRQFEWASLIAFDCSKCRALTPGYVEGASAGDLFGFSWAESVGAIPGEWNHLVGYDPPNPDAKLVHFTKGLPCFPEIQGADSEHGEEWNRIASQLVTTASWQTLMGKSVHSQHLDRRHSGR